MPGDYAQIKHCSAVEEHTPTECLFSMCWPTLYYCCILESAMPKTHNCYSNIIDWKQNKTKLVEKANSSVPDSSTNQRWTLTLLHPWPHLQVCACSAPVYAWTLFSYHHKVGNSLWIGVGYWDDYGARVRWPPWKRRPVQWIFLATIKKPPEHSLSYLCEYLHEINTLFCG